MCGKYTIGILWYFSAVCWVWQLALYSRSLLGWCKVWVSHHSWSVCFPLSYCWLWGLGWPAHSGQTFIFAIPSTCIQLPAVWYSCTVLVRLIFMPFLCAMYRLSRLTVQLVSGVLSTGNASTPTCDSRILYKGDASLIRRDIAFPWASSESSSDERVNCSVWSTSRFALCLVLCFCVASMLMKIWPAQCFAARWLIFLHE